MSLSLSSRDFHPLSLLSSVSDISNLPSASVVTASVVHRSTIPLSIQPLGSLLLEIRLRVGCREHLPQRDAAEDPSQDGLLEPIYQDWGEAFLWEGVVEAKVIDRMAYYCHVCPIEGPKELIFLFSRICSF